MSTPISSGSPDWLRTMAACNCRCADDDDAAGLEAAADKLDDLEAENAALRHSEENLAATVRGLEFELEKAQKTAALLRGTVEALGDANDRLTIEISGLRKEVRRE